jgi:dipeptidyl aminopeptidase/acylaminoacyl peptidase
MTAPHDADRLVHAFLQDGPDEMSPPLLARIRDEVRETSQRTVRRPWRTISMPRTILIIAPLAAVLVAVGAFLLAGSGQHSQSPSPAPSAAPIASPSAAVTPSATPGPSPQPLGAGEAWIVIGGADRASLIRPDGTGRHDILSTTGLSVTDPAWSPDGQQLVYEANGSRGSQLWVANADGTGAHALTPTPPGCPNAVCTEAVNPAWSPDGRTIAFIAPQHDHGVFTQTSLTLLDVATGQTTEVYMTTTTGLGRPTWSPDSQSIALEIDRYVGSVETSAVKDSLIGVIDLRATDRAPKPITDPALIAGYPFWHPTDDRIVFRTNRYDGGTETLLDPKIASNLYTIRSDGTGQSAVTHNAVGGPIVRGPAWTDDGRILYGRLADVQAPELLRIIDADGTNEGSATGDTVTGDEGRWRPTP